MARVTELRGLTYEQCRTYRNAINHGYFEGFEDNPTEWKHTFIGAYAWKHPNRIFILDLICQVAKKRPQWDDITDLLLMDVKEQMLTNYTSNSSRVYMAELKALLNDFHTSFDIPSKRYERILIAKKEPSQAVYLTIEELERVHYYAPQSDTERIVKRYFMIESLTGARTEDARQLSINNLNSHSHTLTYVTTKTKQEVSLPIHHWLKKYLVENDNDLTKRDMSLSTINNTIRHICQACRIGEGVDIKLYRRGRMERGEKWQYVTTHTGRRSFATNLFVLGTDPFTIARFMGHANPNTTIENYIIGYREVPENAMAFFKPQKTTT